MKTTLNEPVPNACEHDYAFVRQDKIEHKYQREYYDVYFCRKCLDYSYVHVRTTEGGHWGQEWKETWSKRQ